MSRSHKGHAATIDLPDSLGRTLEKLGNNVTGVDSSERAKAEAGVSCCSLVFEV